MNIELVERVDIAQAQERYGGMSRAGLNNRLAAVRDALGLETLKEGGKGWITGELLEVMDGLHAHKEGGGTQEEFLSAKVRERSGGTSSFSGRAEVPEKRNSGALVKAQGNTEQGLGMAMLVEALTQRLPKSDPLANLRALKEAATEGWILSSSQVSELLGVVPRGKEFERHGFTFHRSGNVGAQSGWIVKHPSTS
jgi:hypothetical protein